jgi:protocatechuate 3,4-dioxygenase beta subunit
MLLAGVWGAGTFLGVGPLNDSNEISGTVYNEEGEPVQGAIVEIHSEEDRKVPVINSKAVMTNENGEYGFYLESDEGSYAITVSNTTVDYAAKTGVNPKNTDVNFGEPSPSAENTGAGGSESGLFTNLPMIGETNSSEQNANSTDEVAVTRHNQTSTDDDDDDATTNSGSENDNDDQEQVIEVLNGTVVDNNGDPIAFATVTIEYANGDRLTPEITTDENGQYRIENVTYNRNLQDSTLEWKVSKEGYTQVTRSADLSWYGNPEEGIIRDIVLSQK